MWSTSTAPAGMPAKAPSAPRTTSRRSVSLPTQQNTMSAPAEAWRGVPVIILTSRTREHDAVRALGLGADDYLTKPFSPAELVARIRRRIGP